MAELKQIKPNSNKAVVSDLIRLLAVMLTMAVFFSILFIYNQKTNYLVSFSHRLYTFIIK